MVYAFTPIASSRQLIAYLIGTNDLWIYGKNDAKRDSFANFLLAAAAYLCIPNSNKVFAQDHDARYFGEWQNCKAYGGKISKKSNVVGNKATFQLFGTSVYLAYTIRDGGDAQFDVSIDSIKMGTFTTSIPDDGTICTYLGRSYGSKILHFSGLSPRAHAVEITIASVTDPDAVVQLDWAAGAGHTIFRTQPTLIVGSLPRNSRDSADATLVEAYNAIIRDSVSKLKADGLNVLYVDVGSNMIPETDFVTDAIHPNDQGHRRIYASILATWSAARLNENLPDQNTPPITVRL